MFELRKHNSCHNLYFVIHYTAPASGRVCVEGFTNITARIQRVVVSRRLTSAPEPGEQNKKQCTEQCTVCRIGFRTFVQSRMSAPSPPVPHIFATTNTFYRIRIFRNVISSAPSQALGFVPPPPPPAKCARIVWSA